MEIINKHLIERLLPFIYYFRNNQSDVILAIDIISIGMPYESLGNI